MKHRVEPRWQRAWFFGGKVVYDLIRQDEVWDDPTYGNGGGDWVKRDTRVATFDRMCDAIRTRNELDYEVI